MANAYKNIWVADATTSVKTVYTCPAETVAVVKSISAYNTHASATPTWTLTVNQSSSSSDFIYKVIASVPAKGKKEFLEGDESTLLILEEGDVLFNPSWQWHCVENLSDYSIGVANRSDLGVNLLNSNNNIFTWSTILTRPLQIIKIKKNIMNNKGTDVNVTGK